MGNFRSGKNRFSKTNELAGPDIVARRHVEGRGEVLLPKDKIASHAIYDAVDIATGNQFFTRILKDDDNAV